MELLFIVMLGAAIGAVPRYLLPGRDTYGSALLPSLGAAVAAAVWAALTWIGWHFDGGWIWFVSLSASAIATVIFPLLITSRRKHRDDLLFEQLLRP